MSVFVVSGSNAPQTTHVVMGSFTKPDNTVQEVNIDVEAISDPVKKAAYDSFFNFVGSYVSVEIVNSPFIGDFNHVTPGSVEKDAIVIDYTTLTQVEKDKIDNAFAALYEISTEESTES